MYGQFGIQKYNIAYSAAQAGPLAVDYPENSNKFAYRLWNSQTNPNGSRPGLAANGKGIAGQCMGEYRYGKRIIHENEKYHAGL